MVLERSISLVKTQQLTTRLEPNTHKQDTHILTLIEVSPPWGCCSLKTWATMCSVVGCNRIRREASPTITYLPIGDRLTEMALGPMKRRGVIPFMGWHPAPCFHPHSFFSHIMYAILISFLQSVENRETCTSYKFYKTFPCFKCSVTKTMKSFKELKPIPQQLPHTSTVLVQTISQASPPAVLCLWLTWRPIKCFLLLQLLMLKLLHFLLMAEVLRLSHPHPPWPLAVCLPNRFVYSISPKLWGAREYTASIPSSGKPLWLLGMKAASSCPSAEISQLASL